MFKLRLIGRGGRASTGKPLRGSQSSPQIAASAALGEASRSVWSDKALLAAALAQPPAWTNSLSSTSARERSINARGGVALPGVTPLATNPSQAAAEGARPGTTTGGPSWRSSTDQR